MLAKRVYGQITNNNDLRNLEQEALQYGGHAVGITRPGTLYKLDPAINKAVVITAEEAAEILEIDIEEIVKFVEKRGHYELPQIEVAPEPTPEPVEEDVEPEADPEEEEAEVYEDEEPEEEEAEEDEQAKAEEPEGPRQGLARANEKLSDLAETAVEGNLNLMEILLELKAIHVVLDQIDSKLLD